MKIPDHSLEPTDRDQSMRSRRFERLPETLDEAITELRERRAETRRLRQENELLRQESRLDELTGFPNLRYFREDLTRRAAAAERSGGAVSILMIDLPGLKQINDRAGHDVGDQVIQDFSRILDRNCRDTDLVARVGGDEFAVLLTGEQVGPYLDRLDADLDQGYPLLPAPTEYYLGYGLYLGSGLRHAEEIDRKREHAFAEAQRHLSQDKRRQKEIGPVA